VLLGTIIDGARFGLNSHPIDSFILRKGNLDGCRRRKQTSGSRQAFPRENRVEDAIEAYLAVLNEAPQHQEATQALGDLYARMISRTARRVLRLAIRFVDRAKDETKALAIYNRFLRGGMASSRPNASHDTHSCSKNKIIRMKPSSSTPRPRSYSWRQTR